MDSEEVTIAKKYNSKLYPIYKMLSWDLLFFYAISFMFLTTVKNVDPSQVLLIDAVHMFSKVVLQIPIVGLIDKIGKRQSLIIGNICLALYTLLIMISPNIQVIFLASIFSAAGFVFKGLSESTFLYDCTPHGEDRGKISTSIDGKGSSRYYYLDALSSIITGFLFAISPYLSLGCTLLFNIASTYLATKFKEIQVVEKDSSNVSLKTYIKNLRYSFRFIFKSNRLKSLIFYCAAFSSFWCILNNLRKALLQDIQIPVQYIGIIFAVFGLFSGLAASRQNMFHKRFRNKLMTFLATLIVSTTILSGLVVILNLPNVIMIPVVLIGFSLQFISRGVYYTINKRYLNSFSTSELRTKIYSANTIFEGLACTASSLICAFALNYTSTAYTLIILGILFLLIFMYIIKYMKTRVGLKPEQYRKEDIPVPVK